MTPTARSVSELVAGAQLDVATLRHYASGHNVAAFSITQDSVITI